MTRKTRKLITLLLLISLFMTAMIPAQRVLAADPTVINGRTLTASSAGDSSDWIEIAQFGAYSLILRKDAIQNTGFGNSNSYPSSNARTVVNNWFRNSLSSGARLRSFTVTNNAAQSPYLGSWTNIGNGFSTPTGTAASTGDDVAFLLSFAEAAIFCSTQYVSANGSSYTRSSDAASANFRKLNAVIGAQPTNHWWLRSPGDGRYTGTAGRACTVGMGGFNIWGNDAMLGAVNQYQVSSNIIGIRPALWVGSGIFSNNVRLTYDANGGNNPPAPVDAPANSVITLSTSIPSHATATFQGWSRNQFSTTAEYQPGSQYNMGSTNSTLYAVWRTTPPPPTATLHYSANGGVNPPDSQTAPENTNIRLRDGMPTRTNFSFLGWSSNQTATVPQYQPGDTYNIGVGVKWLYAVWTPQDEGPKGVDGRILPPIKTGDTVNWVEIARHGNYSLIVRSRYLNIRANNQNDPAWQYTPYSTNASANYYTTTCIVRTRINDWFNNRSAADNLANNARMREFTMHNNAMSYLGTASTEIGLTNGFSRPTANAYMRTGDDVSFALSYSESANFISDCRFVRTRNPSTEVSPAVARANWLKIYVPPHDGAFSRICGMWLRSPGDVVGTAGSLSNETLSMRGRAFQMWMDFALAGEAGFVHPALWVEKGIFDDDDVTLTYRANGGVNPPNPQTAPPNSAMTLSLQEPTWTGYRFLGWARSATATAPEFQPGGIYNIGSGNEEIFAVWRRIIYHTLTYDANGGYGAPASQQVEENTATTLSTTIPGHLSSFRFLGWSENPLAQSEDYLPGDPFNIGNGPKTLYAVWETAKIYVIHRDILSTYPISTEEHTVRPGIYGPYLPLPQSGRPGYGPGRLATGSDPASGTVGAFQSRFIIYEYEPVRTVTGKVWPMAVEDYGQGGAFLRKHDVVVELRRTFLTPAGAGLSVNSVLVTGGGFRAGTGEFTFNEVPYGDYVLYIKRPGYLARAMKVTIGPSDPLIVDLKPPGTEDGGIFNLWWGDVDNSLRIDAADIALVIQQISLGYNLYDPRYDASCDFDANGRSDAADISLLLSNLNKHVYLYAGGADVDYFS